MLKEVPADDDELGGDSSPLPQLRTLSIAFQARVNQRTTLIELIALVEATCGWAIGSAWRGYVDSHFHTGEFPGSIAIVGTGTFGQH